MAERTPYRATQASSPYDGIRPIPVSILLDECPQPLQRRRFLPRSRRRCLRETVPLRNHWTATQAWEFRKPLWAPKRPFRGSTIPMLAHSSSNSAFSITKSPRWKPPFTQSTFSTGARTFRYASCSVTRWMDFPRLCSIFATPTSGFRCWDASILSTSPPPGEWCFMNFSESTAEC